MNRKDFFIIKGCCKKKKKKKEYVLRVPKNYDLTFINVPCQYTICMYINAKNLFELAQLPSL